MVAHAVSCGQHTTSLVPFSSMSNIHQWLGGIPQTMTGPWPGPTHAAPGQLGRPRSANCPPSFPYWRTPYIVSEHSPDDARSKESPTSHGSDDGSSAAESDTVYASSCTGSALSWYPGLPLALWSPLFSLSSSHASDDPDDPDEPDDPDGPDDPDHNTPHQTAHRLEFTGLGDDVHVYRDFRSPWRAWQRERNEKEKYYGFRYVDRGQLLAVRHAAIPAQVTALYRFAQGPQPPHEPPNQRVARRREERKHRKAVLKAELEDFKLKIFRLKTLPKSRRR